MKLPASRRWTDEEGRIHYDVVDHGTISCKPLSRVIHARLCDIVLEPDPDE